MSEIAALTEELVSIPSHEDESAAGDAIEEWLRSETDGDVTRDGAGNVLARRGTGDVSLALVGHHDVVPPDPSQLDGDDYVVYEEDGRIYGRGTADMKGAVAACMHAFRDADPSCELAFASFVEEETGGDGAKYAIENGFEPDFAVVAEGSTNYSKEGVTDVVVAHRGRRGSTVTARGTAAHASEPEAGENAVYAACDAVSAIRGLDTPAVDVFGEDLSGSVVVTRIEGGTAKNVIPAECSLTIDERTVPGAHVDLAAVEDVDGVEWTVDDEVPPMACDDESFAETVLSAAEDAQNGVPELVTKPHATDAGWLAEAGTSCVVAGASEPGQAHTRTESASVDVLERCYRLYRGTAERV
jgi:acetylornithine deacetylase